MKRVFDLMVGGKPIMECDKIKLSNAAAYISDKTSGMDDVQFKQWIINKATKDGIYSNKEVEEFREDVVKSEYKYLYSRKDKFGFDYVDVFEMLVIQNDLQVEIEKLLGRKRGL